MSRLIYYLLEFISPLSVVVAFLLIYKRWQRVSSLKVLFIYFLCSTITLGVATYLSHYTINNLFWYNVHGFCSLLILSIYYYQIISRPIYKRIIKVLSVLGLVSYVIVLLVWDDQQTFFSTGYSIVSLLIVFFSIIFLREIFTDASITSVYIDKTVWLVSGLFTYYLCSSLIHVTYKLATQYFLSGSPKTASHPKELWAIHNVIYFLACVFILITLLRIPRHRTPEDL